MSILHSIFGLALSANILVYLPSVSVSHHFVYRPVLRALAERGHHITYITSAEWKDRPANVGQREIRITLEDLMKGDESGGRVMENMFDPISMALTYNKYNKGVLTLAFRHSVTQDLIHSNETYDIVMSEALRSLEGIAALQHRFNANGVVFLTRGDNTWANELIGLPDNPAYMVDAKTGFSDQMNFWERLQNLYLTLYTNWLSYQNLLDHQELVDKYLRYDGWESREPLTKLISDQALVLSNSHISAGYAYPKAPNVKEVGGTNVPEPKPLPEAMEKRLRNSTNGLVYFSMGSNIDLNSPTMGSESLRKFFLSAFAKRKEVVFWKMSGEVKERPSNVFLSPWFPQVDVLAHNQTKVFFTHGGLLSLMEAVSLGVPIIGMPIFGDQRKNILHAVNSGYGIRLEMKNLTETSLNWAIDEIINNPKYKENAMKRAKIFHDRPMKPVDEAVYWIEYVLRHGKILQSISAKMPFSQLYLLDVIGFVSVAIVVAIVLLSVAVKKLWSLASNRKPIRDRKVKKS